MVQLELKKLSFIDKMIISPAWLKELIKLCWANQTHQNKTQKETQKRRHRSSHDSIWEFWDRERSELVKLVLHWTTLVSSVETLTSEVAFYSQICIGFSNKHLCIHCCHVMHSFNHVTSHVDFKFLEIDKSKIKPPKFLKRKFKI